MKIRKNAGFTLMELLVAVGLMVILMTAIVMIFYRSTDVMKIQDARINIYGNARAALDILGSDIQNALPLDGGQQRLWIEDFKRPALGVVPMGNNTDGAIDYIGMITVATAPAGAGSTSRELRTVYVEYFMMNDEDPETSFTGAGYTEAQRSQRQIFVLKRRLWTISTAGALTKLTTQQKSTIPLFTPMPTPTSLATGAGSAPDFLLIEEGDLCHWVLSFNIEAYWDDTPADPNGPGKYSELDEGAPMPFQKAIMPVGDIIPGDPAFPRKFRVTMRVIEGAGERQERVFQRDIWAPLGG